MRGLLTSTSARGSLTTSPPPQNTDTENTGHILDHNKLNTTAISEKFPAVSPVSVSMMVVFSASLRVAAWSVLRARVLAASIFRTILTYDCPLDVVCCLHCFSSSA